MSSYGYRDISHQTHLRELEGPYLSRTRTQRLPLLSDQPTNLPDLHPGHVSRLVPLDEEIRVRRHHRPDQSVILKTRDPLLSPTALRLPIQRQPRGVRLFDLLGRERQQPLLVRGLARSFVPDGGVVECLAFFRGEVLVFGCGFCRGGADRGASGLVAGGFGYEDLPCGGGKAPRSGEQGGGAEGFGLLRGGELGSGCGLLFR
jgi:hypothetical protein